MLIIKTTQPNLSSYQQITAGEIGEIVFPQALPAWSGPNLAEICPLSYSPTVIKSCLDQSCSN